LSSSKLTAVLLLPLVAAACHKGAPADFAPQVSRVDPAGGPSEVDTAIVISGEHFYARGVQSLSAHGGVRVDDGYTATLDGVPLRKVVRVSDTELHAVVPSGLASGVHALIVESPLGQTATLPRGWVASDLPPAQLVVTPKAPAQVSKGQSFTVALEVRNAGGAAALQVSPSTPELTGTGAATMSGAAPAPQDIPGGESRIFSFAMVAAQAGTISVSAKASGVDEVSLRPVDAPAASGQFLVQERPALDAVAQAPAQLIVSVGQTISLSLVVTNSGSATAVATSFPAPTVGPNLQLVSSPGPQDIPGAMGTAIFTWTYQAAQPGFDSPAIDGGAGADANDGTPIPVPATVWPQMVVQVPAQLSVSQSAATPIPAKVSVGQTFSVTITVNNTGEAAALKVLPSIVLQPAGTPVVTTTGTAPVATDIGAGAAAVFTWKLKAIAAGSFSLAFGATGSDANSGSPVPSVPSVSFPVLVQTPAKFTNATLTASPVQVSTGQSVQLTLVATNTGEATAINAAPFGSTTFISDPNVVGQTARFGPAPAAQSVAGGATATWVWTAAIDKAGGPVHFIVNGGGFDQNSGGFAGFPQSTSNQFTVFNGASLTMSTTLSATTLSSGQDVTVSADVNNSGDVAANGVAPRITVSGTATAVPTNSPTTQTIAAQTTATFQWTFHVTGTGTVSFAVNAQGTDNLSGLLVSTAANTGIVRVQLPAALTATVQLPAQLNVGQSTSLIYKVTNTGQAAAKGVIATATGGGVADQTLAASPPDIAPNATATFTFPYQAGAAGTLDLTVSASGTDSNSGATVSVGPDAASAVVQTPASLAMDITGLPATVNVSQSLQATVTVTNSGDSAASVSIPAPTVAGAGAASATPTSFAPRAVPGHGNVTVVFLFTPSTSGSITLTANASGTDSTDRNSVIATPKSSSSVLVQTPSQISATLAIPQTLPLGDTFTASMTVFNSGEATVNLQVPAQPSVAAISTGTATLLSGPTAGSAVALLGQSATLLTWIFTASTEGTLQLDTQISGTDANDLASRSAATSTGTSPIAEAVAMAADPFGDGTTFASLASFSSELWLGPSASGDGAVRMNGDGSGTQQVLWQLEHPTAAKNTSYTGVAAHTIGSKGCVSGSVQCGPDNESGRGLFFSSVVSGTEWLGLTGAHVNTGADYPRYVYLTNRNFVPAGAYTDLAYSDLGGSAPTSATNVTSAVAFHNQLYVGFQDSGGPALEVMSAMPSLPGAGASASDMGASIMPGIGGTSTAMIDSMAVFGPSTGDTLYLANANGFTRTSNPSPGQCTAGLLGLGLFGSCGDWADSTPSAAAYAAKTSLTTNKTSDLEPADRAAPAMATFNGRLYAARNTAAGPQLWACTPSSGTQCRPGDWSLAAANSVGDSQLTQFNDPANAAITLLAATSQHLYVGFDNATRGVVIYRAATLALDISQFHGRLDGPAVDPACTGPGASCPGFGGDGLGLGATRIFDGKVFNLSGAENLYVAAGTGTTPVRVYRATR
jgi:hypothetical protein